MNLHAIGIDLGKTTFRLVRLSQTGEGQVRKKFYRARRTGDPGTSRSGRLRMMWS